jgi:hypothetical protein
VHRYACTFFCFYDLAADFRLFLIVCPTFFAFAFALQAAAIRYSCMMVKSYITATPMDAAPQLESWETKDEHSSSWFIASTIKVHACTPRHNPSF